MRRRSFLGAIAAAVAAPAVALQTKKASEVYPSVKPKGHWKTTSASRTFAASEKIQVGDAVTCNLNEMSVRRAGPGELVEGVAISDSRWTSVPIERVVDVCYRGGPVLVNAKG